MTTRTPAKDRPIEAARLRAAGQGESGELLFVVIAWETKDYGFGEITFIQRGDRLELETETLGKAFARNVLAKLVEDAIKTE